MFDRLSASMALARSSWDVLRTDKKLLIFPVLSGIACFLILASFAAPFLFQPALLDNLLNEQPEPRGDGQAAGPQILFYVLLFAYYFCNYFVVIFFNAALVSCALIRFNGGEPTISDGLQAASSRLPQILAWAAVSATVGVLLKVVENAHEKAGQFISAILGTAWTVMTYFVVPVLVVEKLGPFQAISRSMSIMRKTWGESLVGRFGIGLLLMLLALPGVALVIFGVIAVTSQPAIGFALIVLGVVYFVGLSVVGSALNGIFIGALYQYAANGVVPGDFDRTTLEAAFGPKK